MMRSMFAGVSGLRSHQTMMDVIGNNVANVNTVGFKSSRVLFSDALSQLIRGASSGTGEAAPAGGVTPQQVGLGTQVQSTERLFTQGGTQLTGNATDVSIQGDGMFVVRHDGETLYTRAGGFHFDNQGFLVDPMGGVVQGWAADTQGGIDRSVPVSNIRIPLGQSVDPVATSEIAMRGNLDARAAIGDERSTVIQIVDNQGVSRQITVNFEKTAANEWETTVIDPNGNTIGTPFDVTFDNDGRISSGFTSAALSYTPPGGSAVSFTLDFGSATGAQLTQFGASSDAQAVSQDGMTSGVLRSFAIGPDGTISGVYSNGTSKALGQLAIASFADPKGLIATGENRFRPSTTSGGAVVGVPGEAGRGSLNAGTLEMSNVELSHEFTNLILAQRGFQANSRVITTSDEMIQELVNLKR